MTELGFKYDPSLGIVTGEVGDWTVTLFEYWDMDTSSETLWDDCIIWGTNPEHSVM